MQKTYDRQTAQFLVAVGQNMPDLSSEAMQRWIEHPTQLKETLYSALCPLEISIWKTIKVGTGLMTPDDFCNAIERAGMEVHGQASDILKSRHFLKAREEREEDLVVLSAYQLGFVHETACNVIYNKARSVGLELCVAEIGPQLRRQYPDQPRHERLLISMWPMEVLEDGRRFALNVERPAEGACRLGTVEGDIMSLRSPGERFVFVLPRKRSRTS